MNMTLDMTRFTGQPLANWLANIFDAGRDREQLGLSAL